MTATVEAGCPWQTMQETLAVHGQFVALDPLWPTLSTVGGVIGSNDSGALRLRYGGLRDLLIGITAVLADGTVARSGGKVVKNVAGYDLPKLLCGSFGTLVLLTEITFRLHSVPPHTASLSAAGPADLLGKLLVRLLDSRFSLQSMQLRTSSGASTLDVRLAAMSEVIASQSDEFLAVARSLGLFAQVAAPDVWSARESLFHHPDPAVVFKASMLPTEISPILQSIADLGGEAVAQANGLLFGRVPIPLAPDLLRLRALLEAAGGSLLLLHVPAGSPPLDRWGTPPGSLPLMRAVKQHFDPNHILNPGRLLGTL